MHARNARAPGRSAKAPVILQIIPRLDAGGAERATVEMADALVRAGAKALVASEGGRLADAVIACGGTVIPFRAATKNPGQMVANVGRLGAIVRKLGVDLLHARSRAPAWSALGASRRAGIPFVTTYHGAYGGRSGLKNLYNSVMARGDAVIANSHYTADLIARRHAPPPERVTVIHRGVDNLLFDPDRLDPARPEALRRAWSIAPGERVILQAARLTGWKGHHVMLDAAAEMARSGNLDAVRIVMVGDAQGREDYRRGLLARCDALGLSPHVLLPGHCEDMPAAFALADLAIVASTEPEAFGRASVEAEAMECPVVVSNLGAAPENVVDVASAGPERATGWLVPPGDARALASAVTEALSMSDAERARMGRNARDFARRKRSVAAMQASTLGVYDRLLGSDLQRAFVERQEGRLEEDKPSSCST